MLALRLGRSVSELLQTVGSRELTEWMAFDTISPIGDWRGDYASAQVAAILAEVNRDKKSRPKQFTPRDFMPFLDREEDQHEVVKQVRSVFAPLIKRKKGK